jgi:hypothetical protein
MSVKIAEFAPIPSASVVAATAANPGFARKVRIAQRRSPPRSPGQLISLRSRVPRMPEAPVLIEDRIADARHA